MTKEEVLKTLGQVFHDVAPEVDLTKLDLGSPLRDQIEIDSYDFYNILVKIHERTGVNVPDSVVRELQNLDQLVDFIVQKKV